MGVERVPCFTYVLCRDWGVHRQPATRVTFSPVSGRDQGDGFNAQVKVADNRTSVWHATKEPEYEDWGRGGARQPSLLYTQPYYTQLSLPVFPTMMDLLITNIMGNNDDNNGWYLKGELSPLTVSFIMDGVDYRAFWSQQRQWFGVGIVYHHER